MHETARVGRLALPLAVLLVVLGWLAPTSPGADSSDGTHHQQLLLTEHAAAAAQPPDDDSPQARPVPATSHELAPTSPDNQWATSAPRVAAGSPAGLWYVAGTENAGPPTNVESGNPSRAPPSV